MNKNAEYVKNINGGRNYMSLIGKEINEFKVQSFVNGEFKEVSKEDVLGKWSVFFFYPADFTFVCPTELEDLANKYEEFKNIDCEIYSVSCDTHFVHKAWHDTSKTIQKIQYTMLADPTATLAYQEAKFRKWFKYGLKTQKQKNPSQDKTLTGIHFFNLSLIFLIYKR